MKRVIFVLLMIQSFSGYAQKWYSTDFGFKFSLMLSIGSHQNAIGGKVTLYGGIQNLQLNTSISSRFFANNLGSRCHFWEHRLGLGGVVMWGKQENNINFLQDVALHNSKSNYSIGYGYLFYFDQVGTTQRSGTWNIGIKRIDIQFENDVFGGQAKDRYRTGAISLSFRDSIQQIALKMIIWTGETKNSIWDKTPHEHQPSGFRDLTKNPYGYLNHGILAAEYQRVFTLSQTIGGRIGWDSEYTRHIFQNRISHDLMFLPSKIERNTPHYPMLDEFGNNVWTRKEARKPTFYSKLFIGDDLLY